MPRLGRKKRQGLEPPIHWLESTLCEWEDIPQYSLTNTLHRTRFGDWPGHINPPEIARDDDMVMQTSRVSGLSVLCSPDCRVSNTAGYVSLAMKCLILLGFLYGCLAPRAVAIFLV